FVKFLHCSLRRLERGDRRKQARVFGGRGYFPGKSKGKGPNLAGGAAQAMIRHRTREAEAVLDHVEAIHRVLRRAYPPARGKGPYRRQITVAAIQEIAVERKNNIGPVEPGNEPRIFSEA